MNTRFTSIIMVTLTAALTSQIPAMAQPQAGMVPFTMDHRAAAGGQSPVDVSFLLDAPAGRHGYVVVKDGHLATEDDGHRIRFWGVNITDWSKGSRQIPSKADAPLIAATLARFGVNAVRFQFLDLQAPRGLIKAGDSSRALDTEAFDREDFFIAALEKRGIYIDFNLLVGRPFKEVDGVHDAAMLHQGAKGTSLFDERMIVLEKEYARQLLDHLNPYTKRKYTADPAVAIVEINNEDAINVGFRAPSHFYAKELETLYNKWLIAHRSTEQIAALRQLCSVAADAPVPLIGGRGYGRAPEAPPVRFHTEAEFFNDLQRNYFEDMERYLKQTLGSKSLVIATADHSHSGSGYPMLMATQSMDIIDGHTYWQHPEYYVHKLPMVNDPVNSMVVELSRSAILNKPYTVSEVNEPFPNDYDGEGIPILAAYGALQDWDGIFWYTFEPKPDPAWKPYVGDAFDISLDPVKMPELAAGALLFLRADVAKARNISERSYTAQQVYDSMILPSTDRPYFTPGYPVETALQHEVRISSFDGPPTKIEPETTAPDPLISDTQQLRWYTSAQKKDGLVTVDTPRTEALIGFVKEQARSLNHMTAQVENRFCTLILTSLDARPIASSGKLLLIAGGTVQNSGQLWNSAGTDLTSFGESPTLIDLVRGTLLLRGLQAARGVKLQAIDGAGHPIGSPLQATKVGGDWKLEMGKTVTTWYEVTVER